MRFALGGVRRRRDCDSSDCGGGNDGSPLLGAAVLIAAVPCDECVRKIVEKDLFGQAAFGRGVLF